MNQSEVKSIIRGALDTGDAGIDQNLVKRKQHFFEALLPDESAVKALLLKFDYSPPKTRHNASD